LTNFAGTTVHLLLTSGDQPSPGLENGFEVFKVFKEKPKNLKSKI